MNREFIPPIKFSIVDRYCEWKHCRVIEPFAVPSGFQSLFLYFYAQELSVLESESRMREIDGEIYKKMLYCIEKYSNKGKSLNLADFLDNSVNLIANIQNLCPIYDTSISFINRFF